MARTVLICGAGIAGPALAYWLCRYGLRPTVVEVGPGLRPGGQAVDLRGAGREVAERMGIVARARQASVDERGMAYVNTRGRRVARMPAEMFDGEGIVVEIEIMRGDLAQILYDATFRHDPTKDQVEYLFGDRILDLSQDGDDASQDGDDASQDGDNLSQHGDGVAVRFASGARRTFDLVVGADGVHSGVRELAFGPEQDFVRPLGAYTAYFTVPDPGDLDHWFLMHSAPGGRVAAIRPERLGTAKAMLSFTSPPLDYDRQDVRQQQQILATAFADLGWRVPAMLDAMGDAPDFYFDSICQVHVDSWWRGRVALLGDAGYCAPR